MNIKHSTIITNILMKLYPDVCFLRSCICSSSLCNNWNLTDKHLISNVNFLTSSTNKSIFSSLDLRSSIHWKFLHTLHFQNLQFGFFVICDVNNSIWPPHSLHICNEFWLLFVLNDIVKENGGCPGSNPENSKRTVSQIKPKTARFEC